MIFNTINRFSGISLKINIVILLSILSSFSYSYRPWNNYTLRQSYSIRQKGMGQIDAVLLDRTASTLNNPAFLGLQEVDGNDLSINNSFDKIFTEFKTSETFSENASVFFKPYRKNIGGFGINFGYVSFGSTSTDALGNGGDPDRDILLALSYGRKIKSTVNNENIFGVTLKSYHGNTDNGSLSLPIAIDIGYLLKSSLGIQYGFTVQNIGDNIRNKNDSFMAHREFSWVQQHIVAYPSIWGSAPDPEVLKA